MLKIATSDHEMAGARLMAWWDGDGAPRVLAVDGEALLLERIPAGRSLAEMARDGGDDEAMRILCGVGDRLHAPRARPLPDGLFPLASWFRALAPAAAAHGGILDASLTAAQALLADPRDIVVLHGDLHHYNVLDGGERGWLVIDPKGVLGERAYEYATTLCNPDAALALAPGRLARQAGVIAQAARLDRERLLRWVLAHAGVSAAWLWRTASIRRRRWPSPRSPGPSSALSPAPIRRRRGRSSALRRGEVGRAGGRHRARTPTTPN